MEEIRPIIFNISANKSAYFASDQHFGAPNSKSSKVREALFLQWLNEIEKDCEVLFLLGDLFDFWVEYKYVVPKGFVRILGKIASMQDNGCKIFFFTGNHDLWIKNYFQEELGIAVFHSKQYFLIDNKLFLIAHGDGLGPNDKGYKRMKKLFTNRIAQYFFRALHPDLGMKLGNYFSRKNKLISGNEDVVFLGEEAEWLIQYAKKKLDNHQINYFVFGHRHLPLKVQLSKKSTYINLGDWIQYFTFAKWNSGKIALIDYKKL